MPKLTIDGTEIEVAPGTSILQAAEQLGIEVPRFCYHDRLSVPANCRMCLVEVAPGPPKPQASCALACADNMVVKTNSDMARKARKGVMEFLLINHPLDCPICDQGGECDLQDQAMAYGFDRSRYAESKRAVKDKDFGPLIRTSMNRCIQCTRCVRFGEEIAGIPDLGLVNRGEDVEITTFIGKAVGSELSGNMIDICPVGALTNKPYTFKARPWELRKTDTIDVMDAVGSNIRVDVRGREVMRVLPRLNEDINEEWISDKTRFACDGLKYRRLDRAYIRENGKLRPASWDEALQMAGAKLKAANPQRMAALAGDLCDVESMVAMKDLMTAFGASQTECRLNGENYDVSDRSAYILNQGMSRIEDADAIMLVGTNPRLDAPLLNARIRKAVREKRARVGLVGAAADLNYPYFHSGEGLDALEKMIGDHANGIQAQKPVLLVGERAFRGNGPAVQALLGRAAEAFGLNRDDWNGFGMLHTAASRVGAIDIGFTSANGIDWDGLELVYLLGADDFDLSKIPASAFVIYQGHHGDAGAHRADLILPGVAYTEKDGIYVNTEGRAQRARRAADPLGEAREDWKIVKALSDAAGKSLPYIDLLSLRDRIKASWPHLLAFGELPKVAWRAAGAAGALPQGALPKGPETFYLTNAICRASPTMAKCVETFVHGILDEPELEAAE